jgi:hypothetical protein
MTWAEVCADRSLRDQPCKIETDRFGQIVMSPAKVDHAFFGPDGELEISRLCPAFPRNIDL